MSRSALPAWAADALHGEHHYATNFGALCAAARAYLNCGRTKMEFLHQAAALAELVALDDHRPGRDARYLHRAWDYAQAAPPATFTEAAQVTAALEAVRKQADSEPWGGQAGNSTRAALEAVLVIAERGCTLSPMLAVRTVAEFSGLGKTTAARALARLVERGYLQLVKHSRYTEAAAYRLNPRMTDLDGTDVVPYGVESVSHLRPLADLLVLDAFAPGALGRTAARVLSILDSIEAATASVIASRLGLSARTVRAALERLEAVGAAQRHRSGHGWAWTGRIDELDPEEVAQAYGTAGRNDRRLAAFVQERVWYGDAVEYLRARRRSGPQDMRRYTLHQAATKVRSARHLRAAS